MFSALNDMIVGRVGVRIYILKEARPTGKATTQPDTELISRVAQLRRV